MRPGSQCAQRRAQPRGIAPGPLPLERHLQSDHQLLDLLEVPQLLAREARQSARQAPVLGIGKHQRESRRCGLLLTLGMVVEELTPAAGRRLHPGVGGRREQDVRLRRRSWRQAGWRNRSTCRSSASAAASALGKRSAGSFASSRSSKGCRPSRPAAS